MTQPASLPSGTVVRLKAKTGRRKLKTDLKRQQIFTGALLTFEKGGYHETTLNEIAAAAGVSSGLIYQYFSDKRDLLFQVILEILEAYNRDITNAIVGVADPLERMQRAAIAYYKVINNRVSATLLAYRENKSLDRDQISTLKAKELQTNNLIIDCIKRCMERGYVEDVDPELATYWIVATAHAWGLKNWRLRKIMSFEDYTRSTLGVLLKGMLSEAGRRHLETCSLLDGRPL